jgi:UDP-N-acetylmuramate dehydrogenase
MADGMVKTSAAWLIEHAGFVRGQSMGSARLSSKHALAITSASGGSAADVVALARSIRDAVREKFGVTLTPEPVIVGAGREQW